MTDFLFMSYSSADGKDFALKLADELAAGPPAIPVWLDKRAIRPGRDWDEQVVEAIKGCKGILFVMSADSVRPDSVCKPEWVRGLKYKKPVIPIRIDRDAELPFSLGSREYLNFTGSFESGLARLRKHLAWMDSPEGQLQVLKDRLADAQRELPRVDQEKQAHIRDDIALLDRQIAAQKTAIDDPEAAGQRVRQSIEAGLQGERRPVTPVSGITHGKFINPPPAIAPTWFQDRHSETQQIGQFLKDDALRLLTIVGRGGVGKTALVCRLLRSLEGGRLPDDGGELTVDGIVYLSAARAFHRPNVPDLYASLTMLLPEETVRRLNTVYKNPTTTTRGIIEALVQAIPSGRTAVLLDNFEDMLDVETRRIKDAELDEALRALLELQPHGLKVIITTRVAPSELALVQPALQRRLDLDAGLEHPYAEEILRAMDADGKVGLQKAPEALLARARERTLGYPRALEHLFGILSADRDTSLQELLDDTRRFLPERVVEVLVGEAFSRLDATAQRVMQALAVYRFPVAPAAVDYLLQPYLTTIDSARVLSRLVNMQFARRDAGRYYIHQVDRDYALSRILKGDPDDRDAEAAQFTVAALRHRAAEWFKLSRKPREAWKTLGDLSAQLSEVELRCEGGEYDTAAAVLREFSFDYLFLWGHYRLIIELHERVQAGISDPDLLSGILGDLGAAYGRMGQLEKAIGLCEKALGIAREHNNRWDEGVFLGNLATFLDEAGQSVRAMEFLEQSLTISRDVGDKATESSNFCRLGIRYSAIGQNMRAAEHHQKALDIARDMNDKEKQALVLSCLSASHTDVGEYDESLGCATEALAIARDIGYRLIEADAHFQFGEVNALQENWDEAVRELQDAIGHAGDIGNPYICRNSMECLALIHIHRDNLVAARDLAAAAGKYDVPTSNHYTFAMLGLVAFRQGDRKTARDAFTAAIKEADRLLALTADLYATLETKALSFCGLALCGDAGRIPAAKAAYSAARAITSDAGVMRRVLLRFDALAKSNTDEFLAEVRAAAAGIKPGLQ